MGVLVASIGTAELEMSVSSVQLLTVLLQVDLLDRVVDHFS